MISAKQKILQGYRRYCRQVDQLLDGLETTGGERLNRCPADTGWSVLQTLHHLLLSETMALRYVQKKLPFSQETEKAGWRHRLRHLAVVASLRSPLKFKAPQMVSREYLPDRSTLPEVRTQWQATRAEWIGLLEGLPEEAAHKAVYRHPRIGRLSWNGMLAFLGAHLARHARQIGRAIK